MELKDCIKELEQLKEKCDNSNLKTLLFVTDRKEALFAGSYNRTDVKNMLFEILTKMEKSDRVDFIESVLEKFIK